MNGKESQNKQNISSLLSIRKHDMEGLIMFAPKPSLSARFTERYPLNRVDAHEGGLSLGVC